MSSTEDSHVNRKVPFAGTLEELENRDLLNATNLVATSLSQSEISLTWSLTGTSDTSVVIERATSANGTFQVLATLTAPADIYTDTSCWADTTYFYRVETLTASGSTPFTSTVSATTQSVAAGSLATPTGLAATATSPTTVNVTIPFGSGVTEEYLERSSNGIDYQVIDIPSAGGTYQDTGLTPGVTYSYRIRAASWTAGTSDYSAPVSVTTPTLAATLPSAPSELTATANSATSVTVSWTDNDAAGTQFEVERAIYSNYGLTFAEVGLTSAGATSFTDTTVSAQSAYVYKVFAVNSAGDSSLATPASDVMQSLFGTAVAVATPSAGTTTTVYNIGPGMTYATPDALNWSLLGPGDTVNIYYTPGGYNDLIQISSRGTASNWITINGIPDPTTGALPIINGDGGVLASQFANFYSPEQGAGVILIGMPSGYTDGYQPGYIKIQNLEIEGGNENNSFTNTNGTVQKYGAFTAGITIERGDHITIQNCTLTDNGLGVFGDSENTFDHLMTNITLDGNYIYNNGVVGSYLEHGSYLEGIDTTYEYNYYGQNVAGSGGADLKDRGVGTVIMDNYFVESGGNVLDLCDAEDMYTLAPTLPEYHETYVYGNVIVADSTSGGSA
jgi:hypothetical protein